MAAMTHREMLHNLLLNFSPLLAVVGITLIMFWLLKRKKK
jgi:mannose/fructose/N-acetylgalactosamine-specific phosphotransferase system component IID